MMQEQKNALFQYLTEQKLKKLSHRKLQDLMETNGAIEIETIPTEQEVAQMSHTDLLYTLRHCPASKFFGMLRVNLTYEAMSEDVAREYAFGMV